MDFNHYILLFLSLKHTSVICFAMRQEAIAHSAQENVFSGINIEITEVKCGKINHRRKQMDKIILYCTKGEETKSNLHNCNSPSPLSTWQQPQHLPSNLCNDVLILEVFFNFNVSMIV